jgi:hypothetical protein
MSPGLEWNEVYPTVWMSVAGVVCLEYVSGTSGWIFYPVEAASIPSGPYPTMEKAMEAAEHHA